MGKETTRGTAASTFAYIPVEPPQTTPGQKYLEDTGLRGSPVALYGVVMANRADSIELKGNVYADTFPNLLMAALGNTDTITGSGPYVHTLKLLNNTSTGSQPPSYTFQDYDGTDYARQLVGSQLDNLSLTFGAETAFAWSSKFIANPLTNVSKPTPSWSTEKFIPAWNCAVSLNGSANAKVGEGELNITRGTESIFTMGTAGPYFNFAGPISVDGKFTLIYESGDSTITWGTTAQSAFAVDLTFTEPVSSHIIDLHCSTTQPEEPKVTRGKSYVEVEFMFKASANVTDAATGAGYSPIATTITNGQSTAY